MVGDLEPEVADGQMVVVELHNEFRGVAFDGSTMDVGRAVEADEVCLTWRTRPELDAERSHPACIAIQSQNEVRLVIDSKDFYSHIVCCLIVRYYLTVSCRASA